MKYFIFCFILFWSVSLRKTSAQNNICENQPFISTPEELYRGRIKEVGMTYGNPYTMFVKDANFSLSTRVEEIRNAILNDIDVNHGYTLHNYAELYKGLYDFAIGPEPAKCSDDDACMHPAWVKDNAIIYLIGLKAAKTLNNKDTFVDMECFRGSCEREYYAGRAYKGLQNLNPKVISCIGSCIGGPACGKLRKKAFDLIQYCEAYDALKTGGKIAAYDGDKNGGDCTPRNKLREFARNFYIESYAFINSVGNFLFGFV